MSVMLHDILCAVALKIAGKQIETIFELTVRPSLMELLEPVATEEITKLYCHDINEFPLQFKCPKLEILIMCKDGKGSTDVPDEFFNEIERLKVLTIIDKSSWQNSTLVLPKSIWLFKGLRTLCIRGCRLDFIFSLQQLEHLETLEFCNCPIMQLPNDIAELKKLKLLDFSRCRVRGNPYKVLGNCTKLEELYFSEIDLNEEELKDQNFAESFGKNDYLTKIETYNVQIGVHVDKLKVDLKSGFLSICPYSDHDTSTSEIEIQVQQDGEPPRKAIQLSKLFVIASGTSVIAQKTKEWVYAPICQIGYSLSFDRYVEDLRTEKRDIEIYER
ncbi:hypothetical protein L6164_013529 [Bauhinia variegata]|uniref:Uncharacterized protein n=1 Tax=Bauhinia variegata TaxID=167791 RepID=A0ACB9NJD3_BAUVA|nr:hypothetical protein L6164_013529 [Bauhinia variegata]